MGPLLTKPEVHALREGGRVQRGVQASVRVAVPMPARSKGGCGAHACASMLAPTCCEHDCVDGREARRQLVAGAKGHAVRHAHGRRGAQQARMRRGKPREVAGQEDQTPQADREPHHRSAGWPAHLAIHCIVQQCLQHQHGDAGQKVGHVELEQDLRPIVSAELAEQRRYGCPSKLVSDLHRSQCACVGKGPHKRQVSCMQTRIVSSQSSFQ